MDLKNYKNINNMPHYDKGKPGVDAYVLAGTTALGLMTNAVDNIYNQPSAKELQGTARSYETNVSGVPVLQQSYVDSDQILGEHNSKTFGNITGGVTSGAAAGAAFGPIGAAVGGVLGGAVSGISSWIGGNELKNKIIAANKRITRSNEYNYSMGATTAARLLYNLLNGNTESQTLYPSAHGGKSVVESAEGPTTEPQNAWVEKNESIWNEDTGHGRYISHGPNDTAAANLKSRDDVFGSKTNPLTGNKFEDDAKPYILAKEELEKKRPKAKGWLAKNTIKTYEDVIKGFDKQLNENLQAIADVQKYVSAAEGYTMPLKAHNGKSALPRFNKGVTPIPWYTNAIPAALGLGASLNQYLDAASQDVYKPNTYASNQYAPAALNTLAGLRVNGYPIAQQLRDLERRSNYTISNSGGLSGAQKYLGRIANTNNLYANTADMWAALQKENNAYKAAWANAALQTGTADAQRRQQANQFDEEYYAKSHAARQQGKLMAVYNFLNNINQYSANEFKRQQGNKMLNLWYAQLTDEQRDYLNGLNNTGKKSYNPGTYNVLYGDAGRRLEYGLNYNPVPKLDYNTLPTTLHWSLYPQDYKIFNLTRKK